MVLHRFSLLALSTTLAFSACGDDDLPPTASAVDTAVDVAAEVAPVSDVGDDSGLDAEPDIDLEPDAEPDAEPDIEPDAEPDAEPDIEPDIEPDAEPDAEPDVPEPECSEDDDAACDDGIECTVDSCDLATGTCSHDVDDTTCDNGLHCDGVEQCNLVDGCVEGEPVVCDDGIECTVDACDEETNSCGAAPEHTVCDDGVFCDGSEVCDSVDGCVEGLAVECDDEVECTVDSCDEEAGACAFVPEASACDNGLFCDGVETCDAALGCIDGEAPNCDDRLFCTVDNCDEAADSCGHEVDDVACDDGVFCDGLEVCDAELGCLNGSAPDCDDSLACTIDICDEDAERCIALADPSACGDGVFCNGTETCDLTLGCVDGPAVDCDDGVDCTEDACDEERDRCVTTSDHTVCDDGVFCDGAEFCSLTEGCVEGPAFDCDDGNDCTVETCDVDVDRCVSRAVDADGDGAAPERCGGEDCDDTTEAFGPDVLEICDGEDQDCDDEVDEGALNTCGTCDPACNEAALGESQEDFLLGDVYRLVWDDEEGGARLSGGYDIPPSLWVPNTAESTFSRWDTDLGVEVARYRVGLPSGECPGSCCWDNGCNMPSRVALDSHGDAYVANRGFGMQGTVAKVWADHDDCVDRNGNAIIDTAAGSTPLDWDTDECIAWNVPVGPVNAVLRALTVDRGDELRPEGYVWAGGYNTNTFYKLDPRTGETLLTVSVPGTPYGAVVLDDDRLWYSTLGSSGIGWVDTVTGEASPLIPTTDAPGRSCGDSYGITADREGRLWVSGWGCEDVIAYDPATASWSRLPLAAEDGSAGRGITVDPDGIVWVGQGGDGAARIHSFPASSFAPGALMDVTPTTLVMPAGHDGPSGVCLDSAGFVWMGHHVTSQLVRIDRETAEITSYAGPNRAYTYSDFSGSVRQNTLGIGYYARTLDSGCADVVWEELNWDATLVAGNHLTVFVQSADTSIGLAAAVPAVAFDVADTVAPFDLGAFLDGAGIGHGRLLQLTLRLETGDAETSPSVTSMRARWSCVDEP